jgi:hypothetical protein
VARPADVPLPVPPGSLPVFVATPRDRRLASSRSLPVGGPFAALLRLVAIRLRLWLGLQTFRSRSRLARSYIPGVETQKHRTSLARRSLELVREMPEFRSRPAQLARGEPLAHLSRTALQARSGRAPPGGPAAPSPEASAEERRKRPPHGLVASSPAARIRC